MSKLPRGISGQQAVRALTRLGFELVRQTGSHVNLRKPLPQGDIPVTVPLHPFLKVGTLRAILRQSRVGLDDFLKAL
jgi:predicted RNA binding protein YcfA (HicA-like mRNA interferase family)